MKMLQTEERTKECDSQGELGDMGVVAGGGAESQDQEVRAQRNRRELGEEERDDIGDERVIYMIILVSFVSLVPVSFELTDSNYSNQVLDCFSPSLRIQTCC